MFLFPVPEHESDSGPHIEYFSHEEDQSDPDFIPSKQTTSLPEQHLRRGDQIRRPPQTIDDYVSYSGFVENFSNSTPIGKVLTSSDKESWLKAMDLEYEAQIDNDTWELVDLPSDRKPLKSKWVFKNKKGASGKVTQYKARLVIEGCGQKKGMDHEESHSPVI
ncbi:hypothetical protein JTB14_015382 [Gonioctena quinquepunctata]|nr:hypothetical protein JTB14_015382 [Gonioctena quinquepunctata]